VSPESIIGILRRLDEIKEDVDEVKQLAKETNGRIRELELWRARMQGAASTARIFWVVVGGVTTAILIRLFTSVNF
jgi:hypothetical protein